MEETRYEDRILAALSHVSVIVYFMGQIVPIVIWATHKDRSKYVRFQALQAAVFQLTLILVFMVGMFAYMGSFFVMMFLGVAGGGEGAMSILFIIPFGIMALIMLAYLVFIVYGVYGAYSTYHGRDFRYAVIGDRLFERLEREAGN
jgi:uncharacterized Tic20 family protein